MNFKSSTVGLGRAVFTVGKLRDAAAFKDVRNAIEWYAAT